MPSHMPRHTLRWVLAACLIAAVISVARLTWLAPAHQQDPPRHPAADPASAAAAGTGPGRAAGPASPPGRVCGNGAILRRGPAAPPPGAVTIPAGDDSGTAIAHSWTMRPDTTYWFAPGTHTLGTGQFSQIIPADGDTFIGAPGAVLDGQGHNLYAFTGTASNVTIKYLTIRDFGVGSSASTPSGDNGGQGVVNHDSGRGWVMKYLTVQGQRGCGRLRRHRRHPQPLVPARQRGVRLPGPGRRLRAIQREAPDH